MIENAEAETEGKKATKGKKAKKGPPASFKKKLQLKLGAGEGNGDVAEDSKKEEVAPN